MSTYCIALRGIREDRGLTMREVGAALGVSHVYVGEVERGKRPPFADKHDGALARVLRLNKGDVAALRLLATVARGTVDVRGLRPEAVARVLRAIERERARAKGEEAGDGR